MMDIVKRLRSRHGIKSGDPECCCAEAADEIERLQELLRGVGANRYWEGRWRNAQAEIERLRTERLAFATESEERRAELGETSERCGLSWSGFNVFGDKASIEEIKRVQHLAGTVPELRSGIVWYARAVKALYETIGEIDRQHAEQLREKGKAERERCALIADKYRCGAEEFQKIIDEAVAAERESNIANLARWIQKVTEVQAEIVKLRAALAAERERCALIADKYRCGLCGMDGKVATAIRNGE